MLTAFKPPGPEGTRGTFSPALAAAPAPPAGAGPAGQRAQGDRDVEDAAGNGGTQRSWSHSQRSLDTTVWWPKSLLVTGEDSGWFCC